MSGFPEELAYVGITPEDDEADEIAAYCDECGAGLGYGPTGILRSMGEDDAGVPIVRVLCRPCAGWES